MNRVRWIYILSALCLILLPIHSTAEDGAPFPSFENSISALNEATELAMVMELTGSSNTLGSSDTSFSTGQGGELIQVTTANIPSPVSSEPEQPTETIADPLEPVNRAFFHFNDKLYFWLLTPVAIGYKTIIPEDGRIGVRNFFSNVMTPVRLGNCLLQANVKCAGIETVRFFLNTTIGLAGFFDPAKKRFNLEKQDKDFGQTLGIWGMGPVFYIDLPILGPLSLRDGLGYIVDISLNPQTYLAIYSVAAGFVNTGGWVLDKVNEASLTIGEYEDLKSAALDPYIALRDAYHQYRQNKIRGR